jgi:hypothetical protein
MKRFVRAFLLALLLIATTSNSSWVATWVWVPYPGQTDPPGKWVMIDLAPNVGQ